MSSFKRLLILILLVTSLPGCVSHWHGREMRSDILALRGQMDHLIEAHRAQKKQLTDTVKTFETRLNAFDKHLDTSIGNLRTTSANSGSTLDELRKTIQDLRGELAEIKFKTVQQGHDVDGLKPPTSAPLPQSRRDLFNFGAKHFESGDCANAIRAFESFSTRFKRDANTDNALAMVGDCQIQQGHYRDALRTLKAILDEYSKGEKVDDALFLMHKSFLGLGKCKKAKIFIETLVSDHPKSNRIKAAKSALKTLKKTCK